MSSFESLDSIFAAEASDAGAQRMDQVLVDPSVSQIIINDSSRVFVTFETGEVTHLERVFHSPAAYTTWINHVLSLTDAGYTDVEAARTSVIEGSFSPDRTQIFGSIHIATREITRGEPIVTVRKQPRRHLSLEDLHRQGMMSDEMYMFLTLAMRARFNILVSGASGAGKTTLVRALGLKVDPAHRIVTCEEIDELHLGERLPNVAALTTYRLRDIEGCLTRETRLEDLVREALRMRADRIWVGETRGLEAYALVKAANSGHDGCVTTVHADDGQQAVKQLITYVMESGVVEEVARDQVARAFNLVVQIKRMERGHRMVTEITELEPVREGAEQRRNTLFAWDATNGMWVTSARPSARLREMARRYNTNIEEAYAVRSAR